MYAYARTYNNETIFVVLNTAASAQNNVAFSVAIPALTTGTYAADNLLAGQTAGTITVGNGGTAQWVPYATIPANGFYVLKLRHVANNAPTIDPVASQTLNLETGAQPVSLTGITDGNGNKAVTVAASSSAPGVVALAVAYTAYQTTGTLTLTPQVVGTATITLTVTDNKGASPDGVNSKTTSFTATVTDLPLAPTNLSLTQASPTSASLSWTDNSGREAGYYLYWATTNTKPAAANATVAANATSYLATDLSAPGRYYFWVEAYNANGGTTATGTLALVAPSSAPTYYLINRWKGTYLYDSNQQVAYAAAPSDPTFQWTLESVNGNQRIRNVGTGGYLNVENQSLPYAQSSSVPDFFTSSQWVLEPYDGYTRLRNVWQGTYLNVENQTGYAQCWAVDASYWSGHWALQPVVSSAAARSAAPAAAQRPASASAQGTTFSVYPNPTPSSQRRLTLLLPTVASTAQVRLLDGQGRRVLDRPVAVVAGQAQLDVAGLAQGLYLVQATTDGATYTSRVVLE